MKTQEPQYSFNDIPEVLSILIKRTEAIEQFLKQLTAGNQLPHNKYLTVKQTAKYLDLAPQTIYDLSSKEKLKKTKKGGRIYFNIKDIISYLNPDEDFGKNDDLDETQFLK